MSQLVKSIAKVDFLGESEFEDVAANILFNEAIVAEPSGPDASEAALINTTDAFLDNQITSIITLDAFLPDIDDSLYLLSLISFENGQYLIDAVVLHVVGILASMYLIDPRMEHFRLKAVAFDHQGDV